MVDPITGVAVATAMGLAVRSKAADTLVKKISGAIGVLWEPRQIRRVARARAESKVSDAIIAAEGKL